MVFTILTLFCLTQNSGMLKLLLNSSSTQAIAGTSFSSDIVKGVSLSNLSSEGDLAKTEQKKCELSEKSIRTCIDVPSSIPFLTLLFLLPLLPRASRVITLLPIQNYQAKPRRIHLTHCRFQE
ncbi:hypothetical protein [Shewanella glacialipiscicola]|uniref:hypothetical protein n=1 Tax=Shewanella glacialipiscicola TaxID=614069 RepID=UPI003D793277